MTGDDGTIRVLLVDDQELLLRGLDQVLGATDDLDVVGRIASLADRAGHGWLYWQYKTYFDPTTSARSTPGASADAESVVDEAEHAKTAKLALLARAFPERIAGSGARWSFDPATGRFELTWHAKRTVDTIVRLPIIVHYTLGIRLRLHGARQTPGPGKLLLRLRGTGRGTARVVVTPR